MDGRRLLNEAFEVYNKGPEAWSINFLLSRKDKVKRYQQKYRILLHNKTGPDAAIP